MCDSIGRCDQFDDVAEPGDAEELKRALGRATEIVTSLPSVGFYARGGESSVAGLLARGLESDQSSGTIVYTAENNNHAAEELASAVAAQDIDGDGVPEVLFARQDGFINVFRLGDGFKLARISVGEPIIGMTVLTGRDGKPCIVVSTRFGLQVFGTDLQKIGGVSLPAQAAAFAGPGGKDKDRVYVVGPDGSVSVLALK